MGVDQGSEYLSRKMLENSETSGFEWKGHQVKLVEVLVPSSVSMFFYGRRMNFYDPISIEQREMMTARICLSS